MGVCSLASVKGVFADGFKININGVCVCMYSLEEINKNTKKKNCRKKKQKQHNDLCRPINKSVA